MRQHVIRFFILAAIGWTAACPAWAGKKAGKNLRILYWNIQNGMWDGQVDNYDRFVNWINAKNPDICVWCEAEDILVTSKDELKPFDEHIFPAAWTEVGARYGHSYMYVSGHRDFHPQVITSKYPIETVAQFVGEKPDSVIMHGAGWAKIEVEGHAFNFVTLHLQPAGYWRFLPKEKKEESARNYGGEKYRRMEMEWILNHTTRTREKPQKELWLMLGDFNSRSRKDNFKYHWSDASQSFLVHNYIEESAPYYYDLVAEMFPGVFVSSMHGDARLDFIYVTKPVMRAVTKVETVVDAYTKPVHTGIKNYWIPSDHLPIIVDINLDKIK